MFCLWIVSYFLAIFSFFLYELFSSLRIIAGLLIFLGVLIGYKNALELNGMQLE